MKKSLVASGFLSAVASLLGVCAVGCSAETGGPEGEVATTSENLSVGSAVKDLKDAVDVNGNDVTDPVRRMFPAHCKVTLGGVEKMVVFGGYNETGTDNPGLGDTYVYTAGSPGTWTKFDSITAGQERGEAQFVKISATKCLLVGGQSKLTNGSVLANAYVFDASAAAGSQWTAAGSLTSGRLKFAASPCGTGSKVVVFGGHTAAGVTTPVAAADSAEVWDGSTTWTSTNLLSPVVSAFAFAARDSQHFVVAGGKKTGGNASEVQALTATTSCALTRQSTVANLQDPANADGSHTLARFGAVAAFRSVDDDSSANTDKLYVTAGRDNNGNHPTDVQQFLVTWNSGTAWTADHSGTGLSLPNGVRLPTTVTGFTPSFTDPNYAVGKLMLVGGEDNSSATLLAGEPVTSVNELDLTGVSDSPAWYTAVTLSSKRLGSAAQYLSGATKVYANSGLNTQTGFAMLTTTEPVTP